MLKIDSWASPLPPGGWNQNGWRGTRGPWCVCRSRGARAWGAHLWSSPSGAPGTRSRTVIIPAARGETEAVSYTLSHMRACQWWRGPSHPGLSPRPCPRRPQLSGPPAGTLGARQRGCRAALRTASRPASLSSLGRRSRSAPPGLPSLCAPACSPASVHRLCHAGVPRAPPAPARPLSRPPPLLPPGIGAVLPSRLPARGFLAR